MKNQAEIQAALIKFAAALDALNVTRNDLAATADKCASEHDLITLEHHMHRVTGALAQVETVQTMMKRVGVSIKALRAGLPENFGEKIPDYFSDAVLCALHGGTALLSSADYGARQFIDNEGRAVKTSMLDLIPPGIDWSILGLVMKTLGR